ncbi:MAG: serine hydrolase, partial [Thermofilaceae archaeon]
GLDAVWTPVASPEDVLSYMSGYEEWVAADPGSRFFYLNEGYALMGMVISKVSGMRYEDFIRERILKPLKMNRTYFSESEVSSDPDTAAPYILSRDGKHIRSRFPYGPTADGGLLSNCFDMSRYVMMLANRGKLEGTSLVSRESIELMEERHASFPGGPFGDESYGYGLIVTDRFWDTRLVHHGGSVLVHTAFIGYVPTERVGVVVLANASGYPLSMIGLYALSTLLGKDPEKLPLLKRDRLLDKLQGIYESFRGSYRFQVKRRGDFLLLEYRDLLTESFTPLAPVEVREDYALFYTVSYGRRVEAEFFIEGDKVTMLYERYRMVKK